MFTGLIREIANVKSLAGSTLSIKAKHKAEILPEVLKKNNITPENIAFIGDDVNDIEIMKEVGFKATTSDGMDFIKDIADYICENRSGNGAFRELAELIIAFNVK